MVRRIKGEKRERYKERVLATKIIETGFWYFKNNRRMWRWCEVNHWRLLLSLHDVQCSNDNKAFLPDRFNIIEWLYTLYILQNSTISFLFFSCCFAVLNLESPSFSSLNMLNCIFWYFVFELLFNKVTWFHLLFGQTIIIIITNLNQYDEEWTIEQTEEFIVF